MRSYRETMEDLRFSPEEKAAITQALLQAAPQAKPHKRKKAALIAVAAAAAALCAACATGALQDAIAALSTRFGSTPEQVETIQKFTHPVLVSDTDNGVTVSVEAVLGDSKRAYLLCRMEREDGQPVLPQNEDTKNVSNGDNTLMFKHAILNSGHPVGDKNATTPYFIDMGLPPEFLDFSVDDHALYFFFDLYPYYEDFPRGEVTFTLENLFSHEFYYTATPSSVISTPPVDRTIPLVDGNWELTFSLPEEIQDVSVELADGQTFLPGKGPVYPEVTIQSLYLTPFHLSIKCTYTLNQEQAQAINALYDPDSQTPLSSWPAEYMLDAIIETEMESYLTLTDGTKIPFYQLGGGNGDISTPGLYGMTIHFREIHPLNTIESVTIGDVTLPLPKQ